MITKSLFDLGAIGAIMEFAKFQASRPWLDVNCPNCSQPLDVPYPDESEGPADATGCECTNCGAVCTVYLDWTPAYTVREVVAEEPL